MCELHAQFYSVDGTVIRDPVLLKCWFEAYVYVYIYYSHHSCFASHGCVTGMASLMPNH